MHRCFASPEQIRGRMIELSPGDAHHAAHVLRLPVGSPITVLDGLGHVYETALTTVEKRRAVVEIRSQQEISRPVWRIHLAQAMLKNKALDQVLVKSVELGAASVTLLETQHAVSKIDAAEAGRKSEGWRDSMAEAAKQCGTPWLPILQGPISLEAWLKNLPPMDLRLVASLKPGAAHLRSITDRFTSTHGARPQSAVVVIGPEGDLSPIETQRLEEAGFLPLTLGQSVLRAETAATAALAVLMHELSA